MKWTNETCWIKADVQRPESMGIRFMNWYENKLEGSGNTAWLDTYLYFKFPVNIGWLFHSHLTIRKYTVPLRYADMTIFQHKSIA